MIDIFKKVWRLLLIKEKRQLILLLFMMFIGMGLETLSVGLILPVIGFLSDESALTQFPALNYLLEFLGKQNTEILIVWAMILLLLVYVIKNVFLAMLAWVQVSFISEVKARLSQTLFKLYLEQPYTFHLNRNSAHLIRNAFSEIGTIVGAGLQPALYLITEGLVLIGITILLLKIEPFGILVMVSILGLTGLVFYKVTRGKLHKWGESKHIHEGMRIQHLQEGLGGVKDIKLLGREDEFLENYAHHNFGSAKIQRNQSMLQHIPRLSIEVLAICSLIILVLIMRSRGGEMEDILPVTAVFLAAAFRLMPSFNRILTALQQIKYGLYAVESLYNEFNLLSNKALVEPQVAKFKFIDNISFNNVTFSYHGNNENVLNNISFAIKKGDSVGIVGGSGAGKSTLANILLGLIKPNTGNVSVDNNDINCFLRDWQDTLGYVPQDIYLTDDSLRRNIAFGLSEEHIDNNAVSEALKMAQLEEFVTTLPNGINTVIGERGIRLSGGQRQRIGIARALYNDPSVLVLDEATSALDLETEKGVMESVEFLHGNKTIIIIAHRLSTVENCDTLVRIEKGELKQIGTYKEVIGI